MRIVAICAGAAALHLAALWYVARVTSPTVDEVGHVPAGMLHWQFGWFRPYHVNPPLQRLVATMPGPFSAEQWDYKLYTSPPQHRPDFIFGRELLVRHGAAAFRWFIEARWASAFFSIIGAYFCYRWARDLYGGAAAVLALALWCICPNIIGHASLCTPDVAASALGVGAVFVFHRWLTSPTWKNAALMAVMMGLVQLGKFTWMILFALFPIVWTVYRGRAKPRGREAWHLGVMALVSLLIINLGYGFEGSFATLGDYRFISESLAGEHQTETMANRFRDTWLESLRVPLPMNYVGGIDYLKWEFEQKKLSYLRGEWRLGGWWYYYLYGCLIKVPLGTWLLGLMALGVTVAEVWRRRCRRESVRGQSTLAEHPLPNPLPEGEGTRTTWRDEVVLLAPAVAVFVLVSSQTGFNHHLRYVLPAFPFFFVWISKVARVFDARGGHSITNYELRITKAGGRPTNPEGEERERRGEDGITNYKLRITKAWKVWLLRGAVAGALLWSVVSSLSVYPHSLSYFNELVGGPKNGHWHLGNSNVDWGQDLFYLKDWYDEHPEARPLHLAYDMPFIDPKIVGIEYERVPSGPIMNRPGAPKTPNWPWGDVPEDRNLIVPDEPTSGSAGASPSLGPFPGWYILSANQIHRLEGDYEYFLELEPVDWIGYSMMVFHITPDEANRVRTKLGLTQLNPE